MDDSLMMVGILAYIKNKNLSRSHSCLSSEANDIIKKGVKRKDRKTLENILIRRMRDFLSPTYSDSLRNTITGEQRSYDSNNPDHYISSYAQMAKYIKRCEPLIQIQLCKLYFPIMVLICLEMVILNMEK